MFDFVQVKFSENIKNMKVTCCCCQNTVLIYNAWANTSGKSFKSYYCEPCKNRIKWNIPTTK